MQTINISCPNGGTDDLLARLKGQVFHLTSRSAYDAILESGEIAHNKNRRFKLNTSSERSFGRLMGYVCFFDLRNEAPEFIEDILHCYYFLRPSWFGEISEEYTIWDLAYLILNPIYYDRLIPYKILHEHHKKTGEFLHAIPNGEVWIENRVPINWVDTVFLAKIRVAAPDINTLPGILHRMEFEQIPPVWND